MPAKISMFLNLALMYVRVCGYVCVCCQSCSDLMTGLHAAELYPHLLREALSQQPRKKSYSATLLHEWAIFAHDPRGENIAK